MTQGLLHNSPYNTGMVELFRYSIFFFNVYLLIWLLWVLVAAHRNFICRVRGLYCHVPIFQLWPVISKLQYVNSGFWHVESSSLTRDSTWAPCTGNLES